jgi:hypothetical protein
LQTCNRIVFLFAKAAISAGADIAEHLETGKKNYISILKGC